MKNSWFSKVGWIYRPRTWQGVLITLGFIIFCIHIFIIVDRNTHSASDTLYGIFPYVVPAFLVYLWIGSQES